MHNRLLLMVFILCLTAAESRAAAPQEPVLIEADDMHYDRDSQIVSAVGSVEIVQGERIVLAQRVMYHEPSGTVYALGDVSILEPDGNVYFAQKVQLKDDLKQGVINQFKARLSDNSLLAASKATQVNENLIELENAVYSPCRVCAGDRESDPLWQLKARRVIHDKEDQRIRYHHARMEFMGFPVLYSPYFSHAAPDAKRKSGFLMPSYGVSTSLGTIIETPYYLNIAPDMDATIAPMYASLEAPVLKGEFRHLLPSGQYSLAGSVTNPDQRSNTGAPIAGDDIRGHIEGAGHFALNDMWSWGFNAKRSSDDTYLRRYEISNEDMLTSRLYMEGFGKSYFDRTYASAEALSFQGLRTDDVPGLTPLVLPMMQFEHTMPLSFLGSRLEFSGNLLSVMRDEASDSQRISLAGEWVAPYRTSGGHLLTFSSALRGDLYYISGIQTGAKDEEDTVGRLIPEVALNWKYPLVNYDSGRKILVEPQVEVIASPNGNNPSDIPNNDSQSVEFSDSNLFSRDRHTGLDRVESGTRVNYGITTQIQMASDAALNLLFGQTYHLDDDNVTAFGITPGDSFSDYLGRIEWESEMLYLAYRVRLDEERLAILRNEVTAGLNLYPFRFNTTYLSLDNDPNLSDRQEIIADAAFNLTKNWMLTASGHRDLEGEGRWVTSGMGIGYQNECLTLLSSIRRAYYRDRDVEPATSYLLQLKLKNLN